MSYNFYSEGGEQYASQEKKESRKKARKEKNRKKEKAVIFKTKVHPTVYPCLIRSDGFFRCTTLNQVPRDYSYEICCKPRIDETRFFRYSVRYSEMVSFSPKKP